MFTGIIQAQGKLSGIRKKQGITHLTIETNTLRNTLKNGDSVAINGTCLTVVRHTSHNCSFEIVKETLDHTNLGKLKKGDEVNLETALKLNQGLDGHLVQGHIDACVSVKATTRKRGQLILKISMPGILKSFIAYKGSIAINGVSLTVSKITTTSFEVTVIPYTASHTNLGKLKKGDEVNLEVDLIARYLARIVHTSHGTRSD